MTCEENEKPSLFDFGYPVCMISQSLSSSNVLMVRSRNVGLGGDII